MALSEPLRAPSAAALPGLNPAAYRRHALHSPDCSWVEKNCYVDVWIELLHALQLEPLAVLAATVAIDFEGDQWTFFKPPHEDLKQLYGIDVQELYVWRPLLAHALEHLSAGKFISTEADAFWLPDTQGSDYRQHHVKTTIVLNAIDLDAGRLDYFHNAGYFSLEGEDFERLFGVGTTAAPHALPLFAELVRHDRAVARPARELREVSMGLLRKHLAWRTDHSVRRFRSRFEQDLPELSKLGMEHYHAWVFGTLRQLGAVSELSAAYLRWLDGRLESAAAAFSDLSAVSKSLLLKVARAVNAKRALDAAASFEQMAEAWERASASLREHA